MTLQEVYLFESLNFARLEELEKITVKVAGKAGEVIFYEGDEAKNLHVVAKGLVKVFKTDSKGNTIILGRFGPGEMVAEMPCLEHTAFPASASFEADGEVWKIDYARFEKEFLLTPEVGFGMIRSLTRKIRHLENAIARNMTMGATEKTARFIKENPEVFSTLKKREVATILNVTPETLSRSLRKFKDAGALEDRRGAYRLIDPRQLEPFLTT